MTEPKKLTQAQKTLLDFGPLLAFFAANWKGGIYWATGIFMAATLVTLLITYLATGKIAKFPLFSAIFVGIFGGLTIYLHNDIFIKVKVTLVNALFGGILLAGLAFGKTFLKDVMGDAMQLPDHAWRTLTIRWSILFFALAVLNEFVWRNFTTDQWVNFKVFGLMGLTLLFALANAPFMARHMQSTDEKPSANG
jgi:intracellular septation protein